MSSVLAVLVIPNDGFFASSEAQSLKNSDTGDETSKAVDKEDKAEAPAVLEEVNECLKDQPDKAESPTTDIENVDNDDNDTDRPRIKITLSEDTDDEEADNKEQQTTAENNVNTSPATDHGLKDEKVSTEPDNLALKDGAESDKKSVMFDDGASVMEVEEFTLTEAVRLVLSDLEIDQDVWEESDERTHWQVTFVVPAKRGDEVLKKLTDLGIGKIAYTSLSLYESYYHLEGLPVEKESLAQTSQESSTSKTDMKNKFKEVIGSAMVVSEVVDVVRGNSTLTFDFLMFVILASLIAAVGLAENSSVVLVASMLVSPIMGPILGGTLGLVVNHWSLCRLGVKNELISLAICLLCGFLLGLIAGSVSSNGAFWGSEDAWPTAEMKSRGLLRGLWVGVLIALPSGAAVALSILTRNSGSLVGVAISASLLPPAVNAGMLWAYALITSISPPPTLPYNSSDLKSNNITVSPAVEPTPPHCPRLSDNSYEFVYSCDMASEAAILGAVSLLLTIVNIICIFVMGVLVLKLKEVGPDKVVSEETRSFWKTDLKTARASYVTIKGSTEETISTKQFAKEFAAKFRDEIFPQNSTKNFEEDWKSLVQDMDKDDKFFNPEFLDNLGIKNARRRLLKQLSSAGQSLMSGDDIVCDPKYHTVTGAGKYSNISGSSRYHTVSGLSQNNPPKDNTPLLELEAQMSSAGLPETHAETPGAPPETPVIELDSPFTPPGEVRRRKAKGRLKGRNREMSQEFDYDPNQTRRLRPRHQQLTSVPHDVKYPEMPRSASGRFQITTVKEDEIAS